MEAIGRDVLVKLLSKVIKFSRNSEPIAQIAMGFKGKVTLSVSFSIINKLPPREVASIINDSCRGLHEKKHKFRVTQAPHRPPFTSS